MTESATTQQSFWERAEVVEQFAVREPDHRLRRLADEYAHPRGVRVLDLGAAGGRNTVFLARRGFDVHARDASAAMTAETRRRLAEVTSVEDARRRVRQGRMDALEEFADGSVDLVVALGVYQSAASEPEWNRALAETARILASGARVLVANFTNKLSPDGEGLPRVAGESHVYEGMGSGRGFLVDAPTLDRFFAEHGMFPWTPTVTVSRELDNGGRRVTANAVYIKR